MEDSRSISDDADRGGRCVLVSLSTPPAELMAALSRKNLDLRQHRTVVSAMAEVMVHAREVRSGRTRQPLVVLIVDRTGVPRADEFVAACSIYAPQAVAWTFDRAADPPLRSYHAKANGSHKPAAATPAPTAETPRPKIFVSSSPPPPQVTIVRRAASPSLRLTGSDRARSPEPQADPGRIDSVPAQEAPEIPPALTDDELRMLLSDDYDPTKGRDR